MSPQAADYVRERGASVLWSSESPASGDCVVQSINDGIGILFVSLSQDAPGIAREITNTAITDLTEKNHLSERCCNCRGDDLRSRELALNHGFQLEMAGYYLERSSLAASGKAMQDLRLWQMGDTDAWLELMVESYRDLCAVYAWDPEAILRNRQAFIQDMAERAAHSEAWSLFQNGKLVGGYRLSGAFIEDMVILPEFQNQGLGTALLHEAIRQIGRNGHSKACLRVAEANTGALRLYLREGFSLLSHFAEHGYRAGK